jgi:hypothetical protein
MKKFGQKNLDVLQNIEFGIIEVYRADRSLLDIDAKDAIDALVRHYRCEEEHRTPPTMKLGDRAQRVFQSVQRLCDWRLGRSLFPGEDSAPGPGIAVSELVECLREIQKSIPRCPAGRPPRVSGLRRPLRALRRPLSIQPRQMHLASLRRLI